MEKTCQDLAKKIGDLDTTMRRLLKNSSEKLTLDIYKLKQAHKSMKAYVEQKTCTTMEALEDLGNTVHQTLENMVKVLDEVPEEVQDVLEELGGSATGDDAESALHDIRAMQARWADLANLVEMLIPKSTGGNAVAHASHTLTPPQHAPLLPLAIVPQHTVDATPVETIADAAPSESPMPNDEKVNIEMTEAEPVDGNEEHASGEPEDEHTPMQQDDSKIGLNKEPSGGVDGGLDEQADEQPTKCKLEDDADDGPTDKKKKKAAPVKKKGGRRKAHGKAADTEPVASEQDDVDVEGEEVEA